MPSPSNIRLQIQALIGASGFFRRDCGNRIDQTSTLLQHAKSVLAILGRQSCRGH